MDSAPPRPAPVFLVAAARSGAAVLRQMLAQNPAIAIAPEFNFLVEAISPDGRFMKREAFLRSIEFNLAFKRLGLVIPQGLPFVGIAHNLFDQVAATRPGAQFAGFTVQHDFDRLLWLWPDARFIHLVRDGRDVAHANVAARAAGNMWHGIAEWVEVEMLWDRMSHKLPPERQYIVKYEALAAETEYELRRLCEYLGIGYLPAMLQPVSRHDVQRWRKTDAREVSAAEHRAARWLLQNSYFLSGTVRGPSILRRILFNLRNRLTLANRRRELLGTRLWLKSGFIARFGSRKAKTRLKRIESELLANIES